MLLEDYTPLSKSTFNLKFLFLFFKDLKKPFDKAWKDYETKL